MMCAGGARTDEATCGRPLGIRVDSREYLIVADAYKGIFKVNAVNGKLPVLSHVMRTDRTSCTLTRSFT